MTLSYTEESQMDLKHRFCNSMNTFTKGTYLGQTLLCSCFPQQVLYIFLLSLQIQFPIRISEDVKTALSVWEFGWGPIDAKRTTVFRDSHESCAEKKSQLVVQLKCHMILFLLFVLFSVYGGFGVREMKETLEMSYIFVSLNHIILLEISCLAGNPTQSCLGSLLHLLHLVAGSLGFHRAGNSGKAYGLEFTVTTPQVRVACLLKTWCSILFLASAKGVMAWGPRGLDCCQQLLAIP